MRLAMRRTLGATAVAIGAVLVLAIPASAHTHDQSAQCYGDNIQYTVDLENYNSDVTNSVNITDETTGNVLVDKPDFGSTFKQTFNDAVDNATEAHTFKISVVAGDDKDGSKGFTYTHEDTAGPCVTPPPPTTTTTPPPTTTTTAPPATTTTVQVAAATTTSVPPGAAELPNTGVNAGFPLAIAGALVIVGGGILFWLRYNARKGKA